MIRVKRQIASLWLFVTFVIILLPSVLVAQEESFKKPEKLPASYSFIGDFITGSETRIEGEDVMSSIISPLIYTIYSDGIDLRLYCLSIEDESFTNYRIYRSDGIGVVSEAGDIDFIAGVQASTMQGDMIRQISVTRESLVMVKIPPRSHRIIVTTAKAYTPEAAEKVAKPE